MPRSSTIEGIATLTIVESTMISATATLMKTRPAQRRLLEDSGISLAYLAIGRRGRGFRWVFHRANRPTPVPERANRDEWPASDPTATPTAVDQAEGASGSRAFSV